MKLIKGLIIIILMLTIITTVVLVSKEYDQNGSAPIINIIQDPLTVTCDYSREDLLQGMIAYDPEDGYITDRIIPGSFTSFTEKGVSEIEYYVYDSDNNCGRNKRQIVFSDYSSPKVSLSSPLMFYAKDASNESLTNCLYGKDSLDGDLNHIRVNSSNIDYNKAGDYKISVSLINSFGDISTYDLPVHIIKRTYWGIEIRLTENLVYIKSGAEFDPAAYVKEVEQTQTEELVPQKDWGINIQSNVDTSKPGVYEVRYMIEKKDDKIYGNVSGITWLTVIVTD